MYQTITCQAWVELTGLLVVNEEFCSGEYW
jgi:hypothetical protein